MTMAMPSLSLAASHNATRISDGSVEPVEVDQLNAAPFNLAHEAWLLFYIAMPAIVVHLSLLFVFPQTASAVGLTLGTKELAGSSLGSLAGNLTILSVITGALTAADTLMPRAFGSGMYRQVGQLAVQGFVVCTLLLIPPILPLCTMMEWAFKRLGQDADASMLASEWIRIYLVGLPAILLLRVTQSFLNAQHVVLPLAFGCTIGSFLIHPILLKTIVPALGFWGSGLCVTITQFAMVSLVFLYLWIRPEHKPETWPGLSRAFVREALRPGPLLRYTKLSLGGVLSLSEWWFWEVVCFLVGSFGVVPFCVHTIVYNTLPLLFMFPMGIGIGLTVRIGTELPKSAKKAKMMAAWCMGFTVILAMIVSLLLYQMRIPIVSLFTNDEEVLQGCERIWGKVCFFTFVLYIFGINQAILRALGMQWHVAAIVFACLWCGALPTMTYKAIYKGEGLDAVWRILPLFYSIMQFFLILSFARIDWHLEAQEPMCICAPSKLIATETTPLIG